MKRNNNYVCFFFQRILHEPIHDLVTKCTQVERLCEKEKKIDAKNCHGQTQHTNKIDRSGSNDTRYT